MYRNAKRRLRLVKRPVKPEAAHAMHWRKRGGLKRVMEKQSSIRNLSVRAALTLERTLELNRTQLILETEDGWAIGLGKLRAVESLGGNNAQETGTLCEEGQKEWEVEVIGFCHLRQINWSETTQAEEEGWY